MAEPVQPSKASEVAMTSLVSTITAADNLNDMPQLLHGAERSVSNGPGSQQLLANNRMGG